MPIYEFECNKCKNKFDYLVRSQNEKVVCEYCGCDKITKLISSFAFKSDGKMQNNNKCGGCTSHNCSGCC